MPFSLPISSVQFCGGCFVVGFLCFFGIFKDTCSYHHNFLTFSSPGKVALNPPVTQPTLPRCFRGHGGLHWELVFPGHIECMFYWRLLPLSALLWFFECHLSPVTGHKGRVPIRLHSVGQTLGVLCPHKLQKAGEARGSSLQVPEVTPSYLLLRASFSRRFGLTILYSLASVLLLLNILSSIVHCPPEENPACCITRNREQISFHEFEQTSSNKQNSV